MLHRGPNPSMETKVTVVCFLGFRRQVDKNRALLGYYAANTGNL